MIIYFVCLLFWIVFSVCCVADGEKIVKVEFFEFPLYYFLGGGGVDGGKWEVG